ncbi:MAG TPA: hypothetical protein PLQ80_00690 [Candidatus Syntrophosphaera sp.]|nr:hypothetical protein [Candidatus Syntrophosphaera sp.]
MKKALFALFLIVALAGLAALDITSTEIGGNWDLSTTWIGGVVPGSSDNVTIQGPVLTGYVSCASLNVTDRGSLLNKPSQSGQVYVSGLCANNGTMAKNTTGNFYVLIASQMHNAGVFTPTELALQGGAIHYLSGTSPYGPASLTDYYAGSPVHLSSGVDFENTNINLQGAQLYLNGNNLGVYGGRLYQTVVQCGTTSSLTMGNNAYLEYVTFSGGNLAFYGEVQIYINVTFTSVGLINNYSVLTNRSGVTITQNLTNGIQTLYNYGTIGNSPGGGTLTLNYYGVYLYNYGTLSNYRFAWSRTGTCYIYHDTSAAPISCGTFACTVTSAAYQLLSDLAFSDCSIDLNSRSVLMNNGAENYDVSSVNSSSSKLLQRIVFSGNPASVLTVNNARLNTVTCTASTVTQGTVLLSSSNSFANLTNHGILRNDTTSTLNLPVSGTLVNNSGATITNGAGPLIITLAGSLFNYGTINHNQLILNNSAQVDLFHSSATPISCAFFLSSGSGGYRLRSDLGFQNCSVDFNLKTVQMHDDSGDYGISVAGASRYLQDAILDGGAQSFISLDGGAYMTNVEADQLYFFDDVLIKSGVEIGSLINYADLSIFDDAQYQLLISTRLENHGTISDGVNYDLMVYLSGDLHNEGSITNRQLNLTGDGVNNVSQSGSSTNFACFFFQVSKTGGHIQLLSDLSFLNSNVLFNAASLVMHDANGSYSITMSGGYFKNALIDGTQGCSLILSNNAWIQDISADQIGFAGTVIAANGVSIGNLINTGNLRDYYGAYTLSVSQSLENYGTIHDSGTGTLALSLSGVLHNHGTIANASIQITGASTHELLQGPTAQAISCDTFTVDHASGDLQLLSDLSFQNCSVNLNGKILRMHDGRAIHNLNLNNSLLYGAVLATQGFSTLNFDNNSGLGSVTGQDIIINGTATIVSGCTFENLTVASGSVVQSGVNIVNLYCNGDLVNHGSIQDNPSLYTDLYLGCRGNLYNYGSMTNHSIHITNTALRDQYLLFAGLVSNPGGLVLESNIGTSDWYKSGVLQYEGYENITVFSTVLCVWKPVSTLGEGRRITISGGAPVSAPLGAEVIREPGMNWLRWNEVSNALYYNVYVSEDPEAEFELLYGYIFDHAPGDGDVWLGIIMDTPAKFFKVTAQN